MRFCRAFIAHYNSRFCQAARPRIKISIDRSIAWQDLERHPVLARDSGRVSHQLVVNYSRMKLTLKPEASPLACAAGGRDLRLSGRTAGDPLEGAAAGLSAFDKLQRVSHAAIVENKRLGEVLAWIKERQDAQPVPSGIEPGHDARARSLA